MMRVPAIQPAIHRVMTASLALFLAVLASAASATTLSLEVTEGRIVSGKHWIEAPFTLRYDLAPAGVYAGSLLVAEDAGVRSRLYIGIKPRPIDIAGGPLFDDEGRLAPPPVPGALKSVAGFVARYERFIRDHLRDGQGAERLPGAIGRFALNDPAVLAALIDGRDALLDISGGVTVELRLPAGDDLAELERELAARVEEAGDAATPLAWFAGDRIVWRAEEHDVALMDSLLARPPEAWNVSWLIRLASDRVGIGPAVVALRERLADGVDSPKALRRLMESSFPEGRKAIRILYREPDRFALGCRDIQLGDLAGALSDAMDIELSVPYRWRKHRVSHLSSGFETAKALVVRLAEHNGLIALEKPEGIELAGIPALREFRVSGGELWTSTLASTDGEWTVIVPPALIHPVPDGGIVAKHWRSGRRLWELPLGHVPIRPLDRDGTLYVGTVEGAVAAVSTTSGEMRWAVYPDAEVRSVEAVFAPARVVGFAGDAVLVLQGEDVLLQLDVADGSLISKRWLADPAMMVQVKPNADNLVFATPSRLVAVDRRSGDVMATRAGAYRSPHEARPCSAVWAIATDDDVLVVDGNLQDVASIPLEAGAVWGVVRNQVVIAGPGPVAKGIRVPGRKTIWETRIGAPPVAFAEAGERAVIACRDGYLYRIDVESGAVLSRVPAEVPPGARIEVKGIGLFWATYGGRLTAARIR